MSPTRIWSKLLGALPPLLLRRRYLNSRSLYVSHVQLSILPGSYERREKGDCLQQWPPVTIGGRPSQHMLSPTEVFYSRITRFRLPGRFFKTLLQADNAVVSHPPWETITYREVKVHLYVQWNIGFALISFKTLLSSLRTVVSPVVAFQYLSNQMSLNAAQGYMLSILTPVSKIAPN